MSNVTVALTPEQQAATLRRVVEIGMVYLRDGDVANKQFGIEAMLALLTGSASVKQFRARFRSPDAPWVDGRPL